MATHTVIYIDEVSQGYLNGNDKCAICERNLGNVRNYKIIIAKLKNSPPSPYLSAETLERICYSHTNIPKEIELNVTYNFSLSVP